MINRTRLTVFKTLADVFILSQPYDAKGAFMLLHAIDVTLKDCELSGFLTASRYHLIAAIDGKQRHLDAAQRSMIHLAVELDSLRRAQR